MRYLPHTQEDIQEMLQTIGAESLEALFPTVPTSVHRSQELNLPEPLTEWELNGHMQALASQVGDSRSITSYLGAGSYDHYIPASVQYLLGRSELSTAYTPYQPEISQGTLQAMFEYQTLITRLLGLEVSNASMYDGATALTEALFMALRIKRKKNVLAVSTLVHPHYREVLKSYLAPTTFELIEIEPDQNGRTDLSSLQGRTDLAAVAVQSPNFFGCIEDLEAAGQIAHEAGALFITCFTEPLAYGLLKNPGSCGADIACGEGQSFGIAQSFGGPGLGIFCTKRDFVRNMPGRLVGQTKDKEGRRGYVLTLSTREQHIRREKATSNICSNQGLCATTAAMYLASLGGTGLRELASLNRDKAEHLKQQLVEAGCSLPFSSPTFNEFVVRFPAGHQEVQKRLQAKGILPGVDLGRYYPELDGHSLVCVTETKSRQDLDILAKEVSA